MVLNEGSLPKHFEQAPSFCKWRVKSRDISLVAEEERVVGDVD